ncbi:MAG: hypothetical protein U5L09_09670 [Bacteroidales bacterium]|nr:hypothetical protein [Bacteroidales bacterium]
METENTTNLLEWNTYEGWEASAYRVLRYAPGADAPEQIAETGAATTSYEDNPAQQPDQGQYSYRVQALAASGNKSSYSNKATANRDTFFRAPNAFRPGGNNAYRFKPVFSNLPPEGYQLLVFNRSGTTDI